MSVVVRYLLVGAGTSMALAVSLLSQSAGQAATAPARQANADVLFPVRDADRRDCSALKGLQLGGGTITNAEMVLAPQVYGAGLGRTSQATSEEVRTDAPFCRVQAVSVPAPGAAVNVEVWLPPRDRWQGTFFGTGNGGAAGKIIYGALRSGLVRGYAVASTDVGTTPEPGGDAFRFGLTNIEQRKNYAHRGIHLMTTIGKAVTERFYGKTAEANIFAGCSGGGYEAMGAAQHYPDDYDGIISGDPAINFAQVGLFQGYSYVATHESPLSQLGEAKLPAIGKAVLAQCDALDGLKDGLIDDPRKCKFDPSVLACADAETDACLTRPQIAAVEKIYGGYHHPRTGKLIYPGFPPGAELSGGAATRIANASTGSLINANTPGALIWVLGNDFKAEDWLTFDFAGRTDTLIREMEPWANSSTDLRPFKASGGKLIMYTGWGDPNLNPFDIVNHYQAIEKRVGGRSASQDFSRLFMVPGMYHCSGGPGPNLFGQALVEAAPDGDGDLVRAMEKWVKKGVAPERIVARKHEGDDPKATVLRTRPLCAFPKVARWTGKGSTDRAENFSCVAP